MQIEELLRDLRRTEGAAGAVPTVDPVARAEDVQRHEPGILAFEFAGFHAFLDDAHPKVCVLIHGLLNDDALAFAEQESFTKQDGGHLCVAGYDIKMVVDGTAQALRGRDVEFADLGELTAKAVHRPTGDLKQKFFLARDIMIQASLLQSNFICDILHRRSVIALLVKESDGRLGDLIVLVDSHSLVPPVSLYGAVQF